MMPEADKKPSDPRPKVEQRYIQVAQAKLSQEIFRRLEEKGYGAWLSRHEILGVVLEEQKELVDAVQCGMLRDVQSELMDLAVGAIFGWACIESMKVHW